MEGQISNNQLYYIISVVIYNDFTQVQGLNTQERTLYRVTLYRVTAVKLVVSSHCELGDACELLIKVGGKRNTHISYCIPQ